MEKNPLENYRQIDFSLWSEDDNFNNAINSIYYEIAPHLGKAIKRHRETYIKNLKVAVLNLFYNYDLNPELYTAYSRNRNFEWYKKNFRYNRNEVSYVIVKVFDALYKSGFIESSKKGFLNRNTGFGRISRIIASKKLIKVINKYSFKKNRIFKNSEIIELRDKKRIRVRNKRRIKEKKGKLIDYKDTKDTIKMRKNLILINNFLQDQVLDLSNYIKNKITLDRGYPIDFNNNTLRRVFANGSFEDGGRFYGHWVEPLKKKYRKHLKINGKSVCEIDYKEFHIRMLYSILNIDPPNAKDMYRIFGYSPDKRPLLKKILNAHLCAKSSVEAMKGVYKDIRKNTKLKKFSYKDIKGYSKLLMEKHKPIAKYMNCKNGIKLQRIDSDITENILLRLIGKKIPVIPIHDSYIVQANHENELIQTMIAEYKKVIGKEPLFEKEY